MSILQNYFPNRKRANGSPGNTNWNIVGLAASYATYAALLAAGDTPFPGTPADFPTGLPNMVARSIASGGGDGSAMQIFTNSLVAPSVEDDLISASGQQLTYTDECIKSVWVKMSAASDSYMLLGLY